MASTLDTLGRAAAFRRLRRPAGAVRIGWCYVRRPPPAASMTVPPKSVPRHPRPRAPGHPNANHSCPGRGSLPSGTFRVEMAGSADVRRRRLSATPGKSHRSANGRVLPAPGEVRVRTRMRVPLVMIICVLPVTVAADFESGLAAYARGDYPEALRELRPLAEQGDARAQARLGTMYINGEGVAKDAEEGVRWYREAAAQGFVDAQVNLGTAYARGEGVAKDDALAAQWYRMAAEQGDPEAQGLLGMMYQLGIGLRPNVSKAVHWYGKAAEGGYGRAQVALGRMYHRGAGVRKDSVTAAGWYRMAAEQGDPEAQWQLGLMHIDGDGVERDPVQAYAWMTVSLRRAPRLDRGVADSLRARLTADQLESARKLSEKWLRRFESR